MSRASCIAEMGGHNTVHIVPMPQGHRRVVSAFLRAGACGVASGSPAVVGRGARSFAPTRTSRLNEGPSRRGYPLYRRPRLAWRLRGLHRALVRALAHARVRLHVSQRNLAGARAAVREQRHPRTHTHQDIDAERSRTRAVLLRARVRRSQRSRASTGEAALGVCMDGRRIHARLPSMP